MMASRRWPMPTGPSIQCPSPSGPRCAITSVMRFSTGGATGAPSILSNPAIPHMAPGTSADPAQAGGHVLVVVGAHAIVQRDGHGLLSAIARTGKVRGGEPEALAVVGEHVHRVRAG